MRIKNIRVLRGPNYWSVRYHQLISMLLDLEELEFQPTHKIPGFYDRIRALLPSLHEHECSEGRPGGFFERVKDGTWMGHVIEHIALELQKLAGMDAGFGRTRGAGTEGQYYVVFSYLEEEAGKYAAQASVRIADALIKGTSYDLEGDISHLRALWEERGLGPSTGSLVEEARRRNIPVMRLDEGSFLQLGYGAAARKIEAAITSNTGQLAVDKAGNKHETKRILTDAFVPVPSGEMIEHVDKLESVVQSVGFPIVVKPLDGNQGKGATTNIRTMEEAVIAFHRAKEISKKIVIEKFISGNDFRVLVVDNRFVAAALRTPASVTGNGSSTIRELVDQENGHHHRGNGHCNLLTAIRIDAATEELLSKSGYSPETVLPEGTTVYLKSTANLSTGGTATDVTDEVHPDNITLFERIARVMGLDICGIDIMAPELSTPIVSNGGAVIEVNAAPGLRMHLKPTYGSPRNVAAPIIDMLFPNGSDGRIPVIAITGTNGKTTTSRLIANMARQQGFTTGLTTTDGIYINKELIYKGDCAGPASARVILKDPSIEFAVLEAARGGILRNGLGYDLCNCAVVTNVAEDHLGLDGIDTLEKLAKVKSVVPETVMPGGYAVLNADDDLVYAMRERVQEGVKVALFSLFPDSIRIQRHCEAGGIAAIPEDGFILIREGNRLIPVEEVENIPITYGGKAKFNVANVLGATLAAYLTRISMPAIRSTLRNFRSTPEQAPGRMNEFQFSDFTLMVDYAHNPHGLRAFGDFVKAVQASRKIGVIAGIGDRRNEDIVRLAEEAARIFDEIIIRQDDDLRGRTEFEISALLRSGIQRVDPNKKVTYVNNELGAVDLAVRTASPGCFIAVFVDNVMAVCNRVKEHQQAEAAQQQKMKHAI